MATVIEGDFEWDSEKAASNLAKHGISFFEAATVFADPLAIYLDDGSGDERWWRSDSRSESASSTSSASSAEIEIGSSARAEQLPTSATSTREAIHDE